MSGPVRTPQTPPGKWRLPSIEEYESIAAKGCGYLFNHRFVEAMFGIVWTSSLAGNEMVWLLGENAQRVKLPKTPKNPQTGGEFFAQAFYVRNADRIEPRAETGSATSPTAATGSPSSLIVFIGHASPLTGMIAHLGKDNENGVRLAIDEANAAGIKIGGRDATFHLISEDDQANPKIAVNVAKKLVEAKVAGVVGHLNSGASIPASYVYNEANIPVISGSATNPRLTEHGLINVFRIIARDDQQGPAIARVLALTAKPKTVAIVDDSTAYGEGLANVVEIALKAMGIAVLPRQKGTDRTVDWSSVLMNVRGGNADAVFYGGMDTTGGPLVKQGRDLGLKAVFAFGDGACTDEMSKLAGAAAEGLLCSQAGIPPQTADRKFLDAYKKRFNVDPILYAPFAYDAAKLLIEAMKNANSAEPAKYLPELAKIQYTGATGNISFDPKGDRKDAEITVFTIRNGRITPIAIVRGAQGGRWLR